MDALSKKPESAERWPSEAERAAEVLRTAPKPQATSSLLRGAYATMSGDEGGRFERGEGRAN